MAAPKENKFWHRRKSHGRKKYFETPEALLQGAEAYFEECDNRPWYKVEQLKKPTITKDKKGNETLHAMVKLPTTTPYTLSGLCVYLGVNKHYFNDFKKSLETKEKDDEQAVALKKDFSDVITRIEEIIETQQFEGAAVGAFNANIIARKQGLVEKTDVTTKGKELFGGLSETEIDRKIQEYIATRT